MKSSFLTAATLLLTQVAAAPVPNNGTETETSVPASGTNEPAHGRDEASNQHHSDVEGPYEARFYYIPDMYYDDGHQYQNHGWKRDTEGHDRQSPEDYVYDGENEPSHIKRSPNYVPPFSHPGPTMRSWMTYRNNAWKRDAEDHVEQTPEDYVFDGENEPSHIKRSPNYVPPFSHPGPTMRSWMTYRNNAWKRDAEEQDEQTPKDYIYDGENEPTRIKRSPNYVPPFSHPGPTMRSWMTYRNNAWKRDAEDHDEQTPEDYVHDGENEPTRIKRSPNYVPPFSHPGPTMRSWMTYRNNAWKRDAEEQDEQTPEDYVHDGENEPTRIKRSPNYVPPFSHPGPTMRSWMTYRNNAWKRDADEYNREIPEHYGNFY